MARNKVEQSCPCGVSGTASYAHCCGRFIDNGEAPQSAVELMRSRYTAYTLHNDPYLKATWHATTRPVEDVAQDRDVKWLGLEVRRQEQDGDKATVEFVARYKVGGRAHRLHEVSRFVREAGRWYYLDGSFPQNQ